MFPEIPLPRFEQCRLGTEDNVFLPTRAHEGDAGHDVRLYTDSPAWSQELESCFATYRQLILQNNYSVLTELPEKTVRINRTPLLSFTAEQLRDSSELAKVALQQLDTWESKLRNLTGVFLLPGQSVTVPAGFKVALPRLPEPWTMVMKIVGRSGWAGTDRLCVANSPGIIDYLYRKEVHLNLENRSAVPQLILNEARVAQALFEVCLSFDTYKYQVAKIEDTDRGSYGSTGV